MTIEKLEVKDKTGIRKNVTDLLNEHDNGNLEAFAICYKRKDGTVRTYRYGVTAEIFLLLKIFQDDVLENYRGDEEIVNYDGPE